MQMKLNEELILNFQNYLIEEEHSQKTIEKYIRDIYKFYNYLDENEFITKKKVLSFKMHLTQSYRGTSVNSMLVAINSFLGFIGLNDCKVKALKLQRRIICDDTKELSKEEYSRLLKSATHNKRLFMLMQTLCNTGIRVSEHQYVTVEALNEGRAYIQNKGKLRIIFFPKKLVKLLLKYCQEMNIVSGSIFITRSGNILDRSNIWSMMKQLCVDACVDKRKVFPHNLRHLFALTYYGLEKDIVRLADILGHSSIETTRIYTMTTGCEYERQLSKLGFIDF